MLKQQLTDGCGLTLTPAFPCRGGADEQLAEQAPDMDGHGICTGSGGR
jgi:hypothetical protein